MALNSKQRLQKFFYLPLEYQIFNHYFSRSLAYPYSMSLKKLKLIKSIKNNFSSSSTIIDKNHFFQAPQESKNNKTVSYALERLQSSKRIIAQDMSFAMGKESDTNTTFTCCPIDNDEIIIDNCEQKKSICSTGKRKKSTEDEHLESKIVKPNSLRTHSKDEITEKKIVQIVLTPNNDLCNNSAVNSNCQSSTNLSSMEIANNFIMNITNFGSSTSNFDNSLNINFNKSTLKSDSNTLLLDSKSNQIKIMSYNVLSQTLLQSHSYLYQERNQSDLVWHVRFNKIIEEIKRYNSDVVCLQEVEEEHLKYFLSALQNYRHVYKRRTGTNVDGVCIFYKNSIYTLVTFKLVEYFQSERHDLMNKHNVGLIVYLRSKHHDLIVANTHLLYNPRRSDIRNEQYKHFLSQIELMSRSAKDVNTSIIITGDFNSKTDSRLVSSILRNTQFKFRSAYDLNSGFVSTYHDEWCLVDYIFYSSNYLKLINRKELPKVDDNDLRRFPNSVEGSDHLALVAMFQLVI